MAVRQYVGARYVPKFADPVEWEKNKNYESLTIVTYNGSSYTSKVPVPPTVGNPADNKDYWVRTADYNAQVEQYRQTVEGYRETALGSPVYYIENKELAFDTGVTKSNRTIYSTDTHEYDSNTGVMKIKKETVYGE